MRPVGFEPANTARVEQQTHAFLYTAYTYNIYIM